MAADARHHHERCSCGACVSIDARSGIAERLLKDFRERHTACRERRSSESSALDELVAYCWERGLRCIVDYDPIYDEKVACHVMVKGSKPHVADTGKTPDEAAERALARLREREEEGR